MSGPVEADLDLTLEAPQSSGPGSTDYPITASPWSGAPLPSPPSAIKVVEPDPTAHVIINKTGPWDVPVALETLPQEFTITFDGPEDTFVVNFWVTGADADGVDISAGPSGPPTFSGTLTTSGIDVIGGPFPLADVQAFA